MAGKKGMFLTARMEKIFTEGTLQYSGRFGVIDASLSAWICSGTQAILKSNRNMSNNPT